MARKLQRYAIIFSINCVRDRPPKGMPCDRAIACNSVSDCSVRGRVFCLRGLRDARERVTFSCAPLRDLLRDPLRDFRECDLRDARDVRDFRDFLLGIV